MAVQTINLGTPPTGVGGDTPRSAFIKINANFAELATSPAIQNLRVLSAAGYGAGQGGYTGWNDPTDSSGFSGHMAFTANKGGGSGGFSWRSVNADNTQGGPTMTYSYEGQLNIPYRLTLGGRDVVARGVNANGTWIRFADGTQICQKRVATDALTTAVGSVYASNAYGGGAFPAAFVEQPVVVAEASIATNGTSGGIWASSWSANGINEWGNYRAFSATQVAGAGAYINLVATGRWF
ncbi:MULTISPECIES: hypothetical protein [unclassified Pseudomonas]|uniref:hypothetical protein n=1 Tax=unclassified Pseudomonas TaxID=196821 RepID=UPI000D395062|nr:MULTISPECIES: hypothetical protein [unclassified Pseudomonas]RAU43417.1 hypothetical protein DBP26_019645 [Pseudomonas sp. RIT 409]RAU50046.1 hypothetical protein DBY65_023140 [Pseudomonas sp. RIT 412]